MAILAKTGNNPRLPSRGWGDAWGDEMRQITLHESCNPVTVAFRRRSSPSRHHSLCLSAASTLIV